MELKYIVYITVNLVNGKFYIGVHRTNPDVFDGYIGNGIYSLNDAKTLKKKHNYFAHAVIKYGYENFKRTTIAIFPDTEEGRGAAYGLEESIVTKTLIKSKQCYNLQVGGEIGHRDINSYKRIYKFALNGEYLRSYVNARDAALSLPGCENINSAIKAIRNNCLCRVKTAFGYFWSYRKVFVKPTDQSRPVAQYTMSGKFIRHFDSIVEAEITLGLTSIWQALKNPSSSAGNYKWRYFTGSTEDINVKFTTKLQNKVIPIEMFDLNGNFVKEYASVNECIKDYPTFRKQMIQRVLKGQNKSHQGYIFKYKDNDIVSSSLKNEE